MKNRCYFEKIKSYLKFWKKKHFDFSKRNFGEQYFVIIIIIKETNIVEKSKWIILQWILFLKCSEWKLPRMWFLDFFGDQTCVTKANTLWYFSSQPKSLNSLVNLNKVHRIHSNSDSHLLAKNICNCPKFSI